MITLPALYGCKYKVFEPRKCTPAAQTSIVVVLCEKVIINLTGRLDTWFQTTETCFANRFSMGNVFTKVKLVNCEFKFDFFHHEPKNWIRFEQNSACISHFRRCVPDPDILGPKFDTENVFNPSKEAFISWPHQNQLRKGVPYRIVKSRKSSF